MALQSRGFRLSAMPQAGRMTFTPQPLDMRPLQQAAGVLGQHLAMRQQQQFDEAVAAAAQIDPDKNEQDFMAALNTAPARMREQAAMQALQLRSRMDTQDLRQRATEAEVSMLEQRAKDMGQNINALLPIDGTGAANVFQVRGSPSTLLRGLLDEDGQIIDYVRMEPASKPVDEVDFEMRPAGGQDAGADGIYFLPATNDYAVKRGERITKMETVHITGRGGDEGDAGTSVRIPTEARTRIRNLIRDVTKAEQDGDALSLNDARSRLLPLVERYGSESIESEGFVLPDNIDKREFIEDAIETSQRGAYRALPAEAQARVRSAFSEGEDVGPLIEREQEISSKRDELQLLLKEKEKASSKSMFRIIPTRDVKAIDADIDRVTRELDALESGVIQRSGEDEVEEPGGVDFSDDDVEARYRQWRNQAIPQGR